MAISPVAMSVVDAVDVTVNRTLLIQQWHETRLEDLIAVKLEEVQRRFIEAAAALERNGSLDFGRGRVVGLPRRPAGTPATGGSGDRPDLVRVRRRQGTFGGAPLRSDLEALAVVALLGDACYRDILRALVRPERWRRHEKGTQGRATGRRSAYWTWPRCPRRAGRNEVVRGPGMADRAGLPEVRKREDPARFRTGSRCPTGAPIAGRTSPCERGRRWNGRRFRFGSGPSPSAS